MTGSASTRATDGYLPYSAIPATKELLSALGLTDRLLTHLETADLSMGLRDYTGTEPVDLDQLELWLKQPAATTIHYEPFMRFWQLFEMLPPMPQAPDDAGWLSSAVYQHLWIGIYAPRVKLPTPDWGSDELTTLATTLQAGLEWFAVCTYPAS